MIDQRILDALARGERLVYVMAPTRQRGKRMARDQILNNLEYHPVTDATKPQFEMNRASVRELALDWDARLPAGRHASLAQTALQEALMWANAAVACDTPS